jgi:tRNA and rRNA cytosine-C5-methylases
VTEFLAYHRDFALDPAENYLPEQKELINGHYFMALPHKHDTDGFFAARLRRVV